MRTPNNTDIKSLADIQKRKLEIKAELFLCEEKIQESYFNFTHPLSFVNKLLGRDSETTDSECISPFEAAGSIGFKLKRIASVATMAMSVYSLIRKFRRR